MLEYMGPKSLQQKASKEDSSKDKCQWKDLQKYIEKLGSWLARKRFPERKSFMRCVKWVLKNISFYANLIQFDHPGCERCLKLNLKRYIRIENDPSIGWSVVGSGTKHKYLLYFNGQFLCTPKLCDLNLWNSYPTYSNNSQFSSNYTRTRND